jgi:hypothetical protein
MPMKLRNFRRWKTRRRISDQGHVVLSSSSCSTQDDDCSSEIVDVNENEKVWKELTCVAY